MKSEKNEFINIWKQRAEKFYNHWTRDEPVNQIQLAFRMHWYLFQEIIEHNGISGKDCLEVGCGRGTMSCYFADAGYNCTLVDISEDALDAAKTIFSHFDLKGTFVKSDAFDLISDDKSFDIVFSIGLFEHFKDPKKALEEQLRILKTGGLFLAYIVPTHISTAQIKVEWINQILKGYVKYADIKQNKNIEKDKVFRSDYNALFYTKLLKNMPLKNVCFSGIYPLPMISHSIEFPFTLMPPESENIIVEHFKEVLDERRKKYKSNPWLCDVEEGQAFLIWGIKNDHV